MIIQAVMGVEIEDAFRKRLIGIFTAADPI